jgi:plasmid maintenance system killer protein
LIGVLIEIGSLSGQIVTSFTLKVLSILFGCHFCLVSNILQLYSVNVNKQLLFCFVFDARVTVDGS